MRKCIMMTAALLICAASFAQPRRWPENTPVNYAPMPLPYLKDKPAVINIDCGRQLFVDDYLVENCNMERVAHQPQKAGINPTMKPETQTEMGTCGIPGAGCKDGGIWWDPQDKIFKMWYEAGYLHYMAYATSKDGRHWDRPDLDIVPGTNIVIDDILSDSSTAWIDMFTDNPEQRYKMFLRAPNSIAGSKERVTTGWCMASADGIHWDIRYKTGECGDRSTAFYNPFRQKWVYSIRITGKDKNMNLGRSRAYLESADFLKGAKWRTKDIRFWCGADSLDVPYPEIGDKPQLYNLSAVAYESIMIALPQIHYGPDNRVCLKTGMPKITELKVAYSRDGYHWDRTDRETFIKAERTDGAWDWGYIQSVGGLFNIVGDQLWFNYIGYAGNPSLNQGDIRHSGMHYNGSMGIAVLRRDGFVSRRASDTECSLTTVPVEYSGKYLFVNTDCPDGELRVEVIGQDGQVIPGYSAAECIPIRKDKTMINVRWKGHKSLEGIEGPVKFRFIMTDGDLYAFWVSPEESGASYGYNAACGPGFTTGIDTEGKKAYNKARKYMIKL